MTPQMYSRAYDILQFLVDEEHRACGVSNGEDRAGASGRRVGINAKKPSPVLEHWRRLTGT